MSEPKKVPKPKKSPPQEVVVQIPLAELHPFPDHPFQVRDDDSMQETAASVQAHGVLVPGLVRPREEGGYELIAGHRRKHACELAGLTSMPVIVRDIDRDTATIIMVDSNLQRENIEELEQAITNLFHQGTEVGYAESEIDAFLDGIDFDALLQAVWNNSETVYAYRAQGEHECSMNYRGAELFKQRATLLYEDIGEGFIGEVCTARSMELWLLEDMGFAVVANFIVDAGQSQYITEYRVYKGSDWVSSDLCLDLEDLVAELAELCDPYYEHQLTYFEL